MSEWKVDWVNEWMADWVSEHMHEYMTKWINPCMADWVNESMDGRMFPSRLFPGCGLKPSNITNILHSREWCRTRGCDSRCPHQPPGFVPWTIPASLPHWCSKSASTCSFIQSAIHMFVHPISQEPIHSLNYPFMHSCIHSVNQRCIKSLIYPCVHSLNQPCR
jgi:hypothetical protein